MSNSGINVFRYSALIAGLLYGFNTQRSLNVQQKRNQVDRDYRAQESLIARARAEFTKKTMPPESKTPSGNVEQEDEMRRGDSELTCGTWEIVIADPDDPKFDLEAYLTLKEAAEAK
ncbi:hypothetical protein MMC20_005686 [Loxospora ochrophaea]|nr:hypothetical protein [Loxospora ochrophaea]